MVSAARRGLVRRALLLGALGLVSLTGVVQAQSALVNKSAPPFVRKDLQGKLVDLKALRGKVILLNFWATWCGPCQVELPKFQAWQRAYGPSGFQVIAVSMDDESESVRATVRRLHLEVPVVMGDEKLGRLYGGVLGLPITFLIDRKGMIVDRHEGAADLPEMERKVQTLLALR
ncbi:MAG: TlpA disulfide reductase family protein [Terracidiphilus sp.]